MVWLPALSTVARRGWSSCEPFGPIGTPRSNVMRFTGLGQYRDGLGTVASCLNVNRRHLAYVEGQSRGPGDQIKSRRLCPPASTFGS